MERFIVAIQVFLGLTGILTWNLLDVSQNTLMYRGVDAHLTNGLYTIRADIVMHLSWYYTAFCIIALVLIAVWRAHRAS